MIYSNKWVSYYRIFKMLIHVSLATDTLSPEEGVSSHREMPVCHKESFFTTRQYFLGDFFVCFVNSLKISRHCLKQVQLKPINPDLFLRTFFTHETQLASLQLCYWLQQIVLFLMSLPSMKPLQASHTKSFMQMK